VSEPVTKQRESFYNKSYRAVDLNEGEYKLGQRVKHSKFGEGVVIACEGVGKAARVQVRFNQVGAKWLIVGFANLETMA